MFISIFSFSSHHTCLPGESDSWHKEQRRWVHGHGSGEGARTAGLFDCLLSRRGASGGRGEIVSPPQHILHKRHIASNFVTVLCWHERMRKSKVRQPDPQMGKRRQSRSCLTDILPFPWHRGVDEVPEARPHPGWLLQNNGRSGNSFKAKLPKTNFKILAPIPSFSD